MTKIERAPQRLVLQSGSTTLTLDRSEGKATMLRKLLFWARKPIERPLSEIAEVTVDTNVDRASSVEVCKTMLVMRDGSAWGASGRRQEGRDNDSCRDPRLCRHHPALAAGLRIQYRLPATTPESGRRSAPGRPRSRGDRDRQR